MNDFQCTGHLKDHSLSFRYCHYVVRLLLCMSFMLTSCGNYDNTTAGMARGTGSLNGLIIQEQEIYNDGSIVVKCTGGSIDNRGSAFELRIENKKDEACEVVFSQASLNGVIMPTTSHEITVDGGDAVESSVEIANESMQLAGVKRIVTSNLYMSAHNMDSSYGVDNTVLKINIASVNGNIDSEVLETVLLHHKGLTITYKGSHLAENGLLKCYLLVENDTNQSYEINRAELGNINGKPDDSGLISDINQFVPARMSNLFSIDCSVTESEDTTIDQTLRLICLEDSEEIRLPLHFSATEEGVFVDAENAEYIENWGDSHDSEESDYSDSSLTDNTIMSFTEDTFSTNAANEGMHLRIMSYNVAKYNKDTDTYISDEKRFEFKKMLSLTAPDIICLQEERSNIDGDNGIKDTQEYLYNPIWPFKCGSKELAIYTKTELSESGLVRYTDDWRVNRELRWGTMLIGDKVLLLCDTHAIARANGDMNSSVASEESVAARLVEYTHMMQWVTGEIDLAYYDNGYDSTRRMYSPEWDYCIICGDMNSMTEMDRANLATLVNDAGFTMANGGWLGWLETCRTPSGSERYSLDNVICSPNIVINSITAYGSLYEKLYSDHYPFLVDVTLLGL